MNLKEKFESILNDTSTGVISNEYSSHTHKKSSNDNKSGSWKKFVQIVVLGSVIAFLCAIIYFKECHSTKIEEILQHKLQEKLTNSTENENVNEVVEEPEEEVSEDDPLFQRF